MKLEILKNCDYKTSKWSGGETTELYIFPTKSLYSERNFSYRISSATVTVDESNFTKLDGFKRLIMPIKGELKLIHNSKEDVNLKQFEKNNFMGSWDTKSYGKCVDFNLMLGEGYDGDIIAITSNQKYKLTEILKTIKYNKSYFYILEDLILKIEQVGKIKNEIKLLKNDFLIIDDIIKEDNNTFIEFITKEVSNVNCCIGSFIKKIQS